MAYQITCTKCGKPSTNLLDYKCPSCDNPLDLTLDAPFSINKIQKTDYSAWRYKDYFPYANEQDIITLGEGWTPLIKLTKNTSLKLENLNPTGSFKDRGSTTLITTVHRQITKTKGYISEDSSGNAGASLAAYAARADISAKIYVPKKVSGKKLNQIKFYGAQVTKITGTRNKVAQQAQKSEKNKHYIGHVLHPLFRDGMRTLAYEISEQTNWQPPQRIYLPVSAGTLLLGLIAGFKHLLKSKTIQAPPRIIACQTQQVSPLYHKIKNKPYTPPREITSIADALQSTSPPLLNLMARNLEELKGDAEIVTETQTLQAFKELARKGFFVEPSSAVAYAAYQKQIANRNASRQDETTIILTGSGLKTLLKPE
jgi:threonine synthase